MEQCHLIHRPLRHRLPAEGKRISAATTRAADGKAVVRCELQLHVATRLRKDRRNGVGSVAALFHNTPGSRSGRKLGPRRQVDISRPTVPSACRRAERCAIPRYDDYSSKWVVVARR